MAGEGGSNGGLTQKDLHKSRYDKAVNEDGKRVLATVLRELYQGGEESYKNYILSKPGYSPSRYKKLFNNDQQKLLDGNGRAEEFDITLLYILIQETCDLCPDKTTWPKCADPDNPSLENNIYTVKSHRNRLAHVALVLSDSEIDVILNDLEKLYANILDEVFERVNKSAENEKAVLSQNLKTLRTFVIEKEDFQMLQSRLLNYNEALQVAIERMSQGELEPRYSIICEVSPAPWSPRPTAVVKASSVFMPCTVRHDKLLTRKTMFVNLSQTIEVTSILQTKTAYGRLPNVLILTGDAGFGKSTVLKLYLEKWTFKKDDVPGLEKVSILLYSDLRNEAIGSFETLIRNHLIQTLHEVGVSTEHLYNLTMNMNVLIILDGFDEQNTTSHKLVREVLCLPGRNVRVIITTRPGFTNQLNQLVSSDKIKANFVLGGIKEEYHEEFVRKLAGKCVEEADDEEESIADLVQFLPVFKQVFGAYMNSPMMLSLITYLWIECPDKVNSLMTETELMALSQRQVGNRIVKRLLRQGVSHAEEAVASFLRYFEQVSFDTHMNEEFELKPTTVESLEKKCQELQLPPKEVMSNYFAIKRAWNGLDVVYSYQYTHKTMQEYAAASYLASIVKDLEAEKGSETLTITSLLADTEGGLISKNQKLLLYFTGILNQRDDALLRKYAPQILQMVDMEKAADYVNDEEDSDDSDDDDRMVDVTPILSHVYEAHCHQHFVTAAADRLKTTGNWMAQGEGMILALPPVLNFVVPGTLRLDVGFDMDPEKLQELGNVLSDVKTKRIELMLLLWCHLNSASEIGASDRYFDIVRNQSLDSPCLLVDFNGSISSMHQLPETLTGLFLRVGVAELKLLVQELPRLSQLNDLGVVLVDEERRSPSTLPSLPRYTGQALQVVVEGVSEEEVDLQWASSVVARLWPANRRQDKSGELTNLSACCCATRNKVMDSSNSSRLQTNRICFWWSHLTFTGTSRLLQLLSEQRLEGATLVDVLSYLSTTEDEQKILASMTRDLGLGEFYYYSL